jgi:putative hemolysin
MDILIIVVLTLLNGVFAMSEMAVSTSRKARLLALQEAGHKGAAAALKLMEQPTQFLSTVQIGITSIGILNGIVGEAAFSDDVAQWLSAQDIPQSVTPILATGIVVTVITFSTILFGELVPKRLGQLFPESIARSTASVMLTLARLARPFVWLLSNSTSLILSLMRVDMRGNRIVTEEEISASLEEGVDAGVIEEHEHQLVQNVFNLDERSLISMMVPRVEIEWLDASLTVQQALEKVSEQESYSWYPVARGSLDDVLGVVSISRLLGLQDKEDLTVGMLAQQVSFLPETLSGLDLLEQFRSPTERGSSQGRIMLVVDEYGVVQGLVTPRDLLEAITGELLENSSGQDAWATARLDGSWWIDGLMPVSEFKTRLHIKSLPDEDRDLYNTVAGLVMDLAGHMPQVGEQFECEGWVLQVWSLQGRRVERLLATKIKR